MDEETMEWRYTVGSQYENEIFNHQFFTFCSKSRL
jgi:hypothetical protein